MTNNILKFQRLVVVLAGCFVFALMVEGMRIQEKAEAALPPPEGNMTFLDGTNWCVASPGASQFELQNALDWACGLGMADCSMIRPGGPCYEPDTLFSHASFAFNNYYQENGNSDVACVFGGAATLTKNDPSYGKCMYAASGSMKSAATSLLRNILNLSWWRCAGILLLLYTGS